MSCGDARKHPVDNTRLGRELSELEATNPDVAAAAEKYKQMVERMLETPLPVRDGGYEPEIHDCDEHEWRAEDRRPKGGGAADLARKGWYEMYVCHKCRAVRCDSYEHQPTERCLEHRHHHGLHRYPSGRTRKVGA